MKKHKLLAVVLALAMTLSLLPTAALADEGINSLEKLQDALAAAPSSENKIVTLTQNLTVTNGDSISQNAALINIPEGVTLDGGNYTITADNSWTGPNKNHIIGVGTGATVQNLNIVGNTETKSGINIYNSTGVKLENVNISSCGNAAVQVNGSKVTATDLSTQNNSWGAVNVDKEGASFTLNRGNLEEHVQVWTEIPTLSITMPDGYEMVTGAGTNLKEFTYYTTDRAKLGEAYITSGGTTTVYETLADAITAAKSGDTVKLLKDVTLSGTCTISTNNVTLEGNNHTIYAATDGIWPAWNTPVITASGSTGVTVQNCTVDGQNCAVSCVMSGTDTTFNNVTMKNANHGHYYGTGKGNLTFKNCTIDVKVYGINQSQGEATILIDNCDIKGWNSFGSKEKVTVRNTSFGKGGYAQLRFYNDATVTNCTFSDDMCIDVGYSNNAEIAAAVAPYTITYQGCTKNLPALIDLNDERYHTKAVITIDAVGNAREGYTSGFFATRGGEVTAAEGCVKAQIGANLYIIGKDVVTNESYEISGGTFSTDPSAFVAGDYIVKKNSDTAFEVLAKTGLTSGTYLSDPSGATAPYYYVTNNNNGTWTVYYSAPSSGGGSSSGSSNTSTSTTTNKDGSTTTTTTNKTTGTVTEVTKEKDGTTTTVETKKDGTVTETVKTAEGVTGTVVTDKNGDVTEVKSTVSSTAAKEAAKTGEAVTLPVEVPAVKTTEEAPALQVTVPKSADSVKVEIPVEKVTPGTVAVIVNADGTEKIVSTSVVTENGVALTLDGSATVKIIDNSKDFIDVPENNVFYNEISSLSAREIMVGKTDDIFDLHNSVTLDQIANVAGRITGAVDVKDFNAGVSWGADNGLKTGGVAATRGDVLKALYIAAGSPVVEDTSILSIFNDSSAIPADMAAIAAWAAQNGILKGGLDGNANLGVNVTRGQACALAGRTMGTLD